MNSANLGPYGDAIETELLPAIEKQFRAITGGWAHFLYGGSTGGWESLAAQIFYPTEYNGAFRRLPRPDRLPRLRDGRSLPAAQLLSISRELTNK